MEHPRKITSPEPAPFSCTQLNTHYHKQELPAAVVSSSAFLKCLSTAFWEEFSSPSLHMPCLANHGIVPFLFTDIHYCQSGETYLLLEGVGISAAEADLPEESPRGQTNVNRQNDTCSFPSTCRPRPCPKLATHLFCLFLCFLIWESGYAFLFDAELIIISKIGAIIHQPSVVFGHSMWIDDLHWKKSSYKLKIEGREEWRGCQIWDGWCITAWYCAWANLVEQRLRPRWAAVHGP